MWDYAYSLGANTPILYQKRAETCTSGFGVLHFSVRCGWMYHRADFRFLAVFAASISYNCCKKKKEHIIDNIMNIISVREQPQYTQQIIAYLQQCWNKMVPILYSDCKPLCRCCTSTASVVRPGKRGRIYRMCGTYYQ